MSSQENWDLQIDPAVFKALNKIPRSDAEVILQIIRALPLGPYYGDIQKMKGTLDTWRRRVGHYRIFYKIMVANKTILVFHFERRTSTTY